jgi:hypothetical protein
MNISEIKSTDIILYRKTKFSLSKIIQWFEKCKWSHGSLVFDVYGKILTSEAESNGLMANTILESIKGCEIMVLRPKFNIDTIILSQFIAENLGKHRYNYFKLIIVQAIWQLTHRWILNEYKSESLRRVICGEWVAYVIYKLTNLKEFELWYRATPKSLFESVYFEHYKIEL